MRLLWLLVCAIGVGTSMTGALLTAMFGHWVAATLFGIGVIVCLLSAYHILHHSEVSHD